MNMATHRTTPIQRYLIDIIGIKWHYALDSGAEYRAYIGIIIFTLMAANSETDAKHQALQATGTFNPRAAQVKHPLFQQSEFFDPHDYAANHN
jgi:hypothetical protein